MALTDYDFTKLIDKHESFKLKFGDLKIEECYENSKWKGKEYNWICQFIKEIFRYRWWLSGKYEMRFNWII